MSIHYIRETHDLENVIFVCFGRPRGQELPQAIRANDAVIDFTLHNSPKPPNLPL